jgi:phosphoenolpyruvate carboxykinase (GTP)
VHEAFDWRHGVFLGSIMSSETTAAAESAVGKLRHDPFAMLPFCGYNMADYLAHWLSFPERTDEGKLPRIFYVNWFRKDAGGHYLWPGFSENARVLEWIFERCAGRGHAVRTPIGWLPAESDLDLEGLEIPERDVAELLAVDASAWLAEVPHIRDFYAQFGERMPAALHAELDALELRLRDAGQGDAGQGDAGQGDAGQGDAEWGDAEWGDAGQG